MLSSSHLGDFEPNQCSQRSSGGCCETGCGLASFFLFRFRGAGMSCAAPRCAVRRDASDSSACLHPAHFLAECCDRRGDDGWDACLRCGERRTAAALVDRCLYGQRSRGETRNHGDKRSSSTERSRGGHAREILKASVFLAHACVTQLSPRVEASKMVGSAAVPTEGAMCASFRSACSLRWEWKMP